MLYEEQKAIIELQKRQIEVFKKRIEIADKLTGSYEKLIGLHKKRNMFLVVIFTIIQVISVILWSIYIKNK